MIFVVATTKIIGCSESGPFAILVKPSIVYFERIYTE